MEDRREAAVESRKEERLAMMFPDRARRYSKVEIAANIGKSVKTADNWLKEFSDTVTAHEQGWKEPFLYSLKS
jgi:transposase